MDKINQEKKNEWILHACAMVLASTSSFAMSSNEYTNRKNHGYMQPSNILDRVLELADYIEKHTNLFNELNQKEEGDSI